MLVNKSYRKVKKDGNSWGIAMTEHLKELDIKLGDKVHVAVEIIGNSKRIVIENIKGD